MEESQQSIDRAKAPSSNKGEAREVVLGVGRRLRPCSQRIFGEMRLRVPG